MSNFASRLHLSVGIAALIAINAIGCSKPSEVLPAGGLSTTAGTTVALKFEDLSLPQSSESLAATDVVPHLEVSIEPGCNQIYCGTFKLVWDVYGESTQVKDKATARALDRLTFSTADLDPNCFLTLVGNREKIQSNMRDRFPRADIELPETVNAADSTAFAYLQKSLPFRERFSRLTDPMTFRSKLGNTSVAVFGFEDFQESNERATLLRHQVTIIDYKNADDFVIRLNTVSPRDRMYLAKVAPSNTLEETLRRVQARVARGYDEQSESSQLQDGEALSVPIVSVNVFREFSDLVPLNLPEHERKAWAACQVIRFRLDESGAKLESYAAYDSLDSSAPRRFILDAPFLLYLVQESSRNPYFVAWIANAEVLEIMPQLK